jgi:hypothetical protein
MNNNKESHVSYFSHFCDKTPGISNINNLKEEGFIFGSWLQKFQFRVHSTIDFWARGEADRHGGGR